MNELRPDVARKYYVHIIKPGKYNFKDFGDIDLCSITVEQADSLVARGFTFLKLKKQPPPPPPILENTVSANEVKQPVSANEVKQPQPDNPTTTPPDIMEFRANKGYINKLLTMNWEHLNYEEKKIFFDDQANFLAKKQALFHISNIDRMMQGLHAKMRNQAANAAGNAKRSELLEQITKSDEARRDHWKVIDDWTEPSAEKMGELSENAKIEKAKKEALEQHKRQLANDQYIWRNLPRLDDPNVPEKKKIQLAAEIEKRKAENIAFGKPYDRQIRSYKKQ